jgi:hypothetical protein
MMEDMQSDDAVRIKYSSKYARISNYWKYFIGQSKGLKRLTVYEKKAVQEGEFRDWVNQNPERKAKYDKALENIEQAYKKLSEFDLVSVYQSEAVRQGAEILGFAGEFSDLKKELMEKELNQEKVNKMIAQLKQRASSYFKDYNMPTDIKLLSAMLEMFHTNVPINQQPDYLKLIGSKYKGDFEKFADMVFETSIFASSERVEAFLKNPSAKALDKDPAYKTMRELNNYFVDQIKPQVDAAYELLDRGNRDYIAGLREMQPDRKFYPDANGTMRMTYGQVLDYFPADAVHYAYFTTLKGVMEKEDPDNWEFVVPEKLKQLYEKKDFGKYGENGIMKTCFLTNHDITGGNSGSPVLNSNGELIGLAFDGNWEAMSGDIAYEPELQRTINVDIRYVLFIIDKYAGASRLVDEMKIVTGRPVSDKELLEQKKFQEQVSFQ